MVGGEVEREQRDGHRAEDETDPGGEGPDDAAEGLRGPVLCGAGGLFAGSAVDEVSLRLTPKVSSSQSLALSIHSDQLSPIGLGDLDDHRDQEDHHDDHEQSAGGIDHADGGAAFPAAVAVQALDKGISARLKKIEMISMPTRSRARYKTTRPARVSSTIAITRQIVLALTVYSTTGGGCRWWICGSGRGRCFVRLYRALRVAHVTSRLDVESSLAERVPNSHSRRRGRLRRRGLGFPMRQARTARYEPRAYLSSQKRHNRSVADVRRRLLLFPILGSLLRGLHPGRFAGHLGVVRGPGGVADAPFLVGGDEAMAASSEQSGFVDAVGEVANSAQRSLKLMRSIARWSMVASSSQRNGVDTHPVCRIE